MTQRFTNAGAMVAMTAVSGNYFLGLGTGESATGLVGEASGASYYRQAVTIVATGPTGVNADTVTFPAFTASQTSFSHAGLFTADTGGTCIWVGPLAKPLAVGPGKAATLEAGEVGVGIGMLGTGTGGGGGGTGTGLPVVTAAPIISGIAQSGQVLTVSSGTWSGTTPIAYSYQWQRGTTNVAGATANTYTLTNADVSHTMRVVVSATNPVGSTQAVTAPTTTVQAAWGTNDLDYTEGLLDYRGDNDLLVTNVGGAISLLTSGQSLPGTLVQPVSANQPSHSVSSDWAAFAATSFTDTNGSFLDNTNIRDRYRATSNALGVFYVLFRVAFIPAWRSVLLHVGAVQPSLTNFLLRSYALRMMTTGELWLGRGGENTNENRVATMPGAFARDEWIAAAFVLNDSRSTGTTNGASDRATRLFAKTRLSGTHPTMTKSETVAQHVAADPSMVCEIGRVRYADTSDSYFDGLRLHSIGFDARPPITDTGIEAVLDRLLARV